MRIHSLRRAFSVLAAATLVVTACATSTTPSSSPQAGAETPVAGGRVIRGSFSDIRTLNPVVSTDATSSQVSSLMYDALINVNPKTGEPVPWLGKWTVSSDNLTFSWEIDAKANWSDGKPIIADDYLARVKAIARSKLTTQKSGFADLEGFNDYRDGKATTISGITLDPSSTKKFTAKFTRSFCPALLTVFGAAPIPAHVFGKYTVDSDATKNIDAAPENAAPTVFSGPFRFKEWRKGDQVILSRNDTYWRGAPYLEEFVQKVVADSTVQASQLKTGELTLGAIQPGDYDDLSKQDTLKLYEWQDNGYVYIGWRLNNPNVPVLQDKRVRQALAYGLDTAAVVQSVVFTHGLKQVSHSPAASWAAATGLNDYKYDKAKAEDLIKQAGYAKGADGFYAKDGKTLGFSIVTNQGNKTRETFLQVATEQYKQIGVKINPKVEAFETLVPKLNSGSNEVESVILGWQLGTDPDLFSIWHSSNVARAEQAGNNFVGYKNPDLDKLIEQGRGPDCTVATRKNIYQQANKILNEDQPYNFAFSQDRILATDKRIRGIEPGSFSPDATWNVEKWWIKQ
ncbi:MAG TPA: ABC transporter substrate-binding protein [Candidatus Limnocylindria bacterium]|nr:ABC transporter substrate-binding protein [Candidatus Limnocylindria bacterium]